MNSELGLWIDHREAIIVRITGPEKTAATTRIESNMESHVRFSGGAAGVSEEDIRDRKFGNHLNAFYDTVVTAIRDADSILIIGPGEAKVELKKRLESHNLGGHIVGVETADKLTEHQVAAKVREHFARQATH